MATYAADCYVNNTSMTIPETVASVIGGVVSGKIGGKGANHNGTLSNVVRSTKQTIVRESRRANQRYARKAVATTISYCRNTLAKSAWSSSFKYSAGCSVSNGLSAFGNWIHNFFSRHSRK